MSTVKTDAIVAVSTNGDLSLDGLGTGGVSIASTLKMNKGGDLSSASPLVIDTDGNYFDVTGTTNFAAMTVEDGNFFMLQFDGALTITHGSGIELPGAANLTTAAGDRLMCYATAANTVEVMSVETEAAAGGGGLVLIDTEVASSTALLTLTGMDTTYDHYLCVMHKLLPATDGTKPQVRLGDSSGIDSGASDYAWAQERFNFAASPSAAQVGDDADSEMNIKNANAIGNDATTDAGLHGFFHLSGSGAMPAIMGSNVSHDNATSWQHINFGGARLSNITVTQVQFMFESGDVASGRFSLYGMVNS
jgi:hypothetical protein